jgi:membrane protease YdiL (CAAX protease family)
MLKSIHDFADRNALWLSILVVVGYFLYFFIPAARSSNSFGRGETHEDMASMTSQLGAELTMAIPVIFLIFLFGWGRSARLTSPLRPHSLRWVLPPTLYTLCLLFAALIMSTQVPEGGFPALSGVIALLATVALIGLFEELLFRGILLRGLESKTGPVLALVVSSVAFGLMHYVNWVGGQPLGDTTIQVLHAIGAGFLYGALMLMTGSIWPSVFLHALWDGSVSLVATVSSAIPPELMTAPSTVDALDDLSADPEGGVSLLDALFGGFEPIYGLIVLLAWLALRRRQASAGASV